MKYLLSNLNNGFSGKNIPSINDENDFQSISREENVTTIYKNSVCLAHSRLPITITTQLWLRMTV